MNDPLRRYVIHKIKSISVISFYLCSLLAFNLTYASEPQPIDEVILPQIIEIPDSKLPQIVEATPIEIIREQTDQFLANVRTELNRTKEGISFEWYTEHVDIKKETNCLAQNIYYESRGEDMAGQLAVALVTVNRVRSIFYPPSICEVVFQHTKNTDTGKIIPQFTWTRYHRKKYTPHDMVAWEQALTIAQRVLTGGRLDNVKDITSGSLLYHATYVHPKKWKKYYTKTLQIGNHVFFKPLKEVVYRDDPVVIAQNEGL